MRAGLDGSVYCGRNEEATGFIHCFSEGLLGLFDSSCFSLVFVAGFCIPCPVRFLEDDVGSKGPSIVDSSELIVSRESSEVLAIDSVGRCSGRKEATSIRTNKALYIGASGVLFMY